MKRFRPKTPNFSRHEEIVPEMRESSPAKPAGTRFATIRRQLLWSYGVLILIIVAMVASFTWMFLDYYAQVDELLSLNAATATITIKLEETHQLLENTINYEDPSFIRPFYSNLDDLKAYIREYDSLALQTADLLDDYDAYYQFLEIQTLILVYSGESKILLDLFGKGTTRFDLYDKLYSLRDLNYRTYQLQSALLVRQNNYLRRFYTDYAPVVQRRLISLLAVTLIFIVFSVLWTLRQATAISDPLHQLVLMNMKLASGDFSAVKPLDARNKEISQLGEAFTYMSGRLSESIETEKRALVMESSLRQARLETLQAQINPHFLFNALNTVRSLSQLESAVQTEAIVDALSAFLRYNLENQDSMVSLADEFAMAEHYLKIQKIRFGNRLDYELYLAPDLNQLKVPSLLVQPLVENSIVHGLESRKSGGTVKLSANIVAGKAVIEVLDNGIGMSRKFIAELDDELAGEVIIEGSHVGIRNTWRRLVLTDPGAKMTFFENPEGRGTIVRISLSPDS